MMTASTPEQLHALFQSAFNARDIDGLMALYEADCAVVPQPGAIAMGMHEVRAALQGLLGLNGPAELVTQHVVTVGDISLMSCRWSLSGTGSDGQPLTVGGVTAEVARRQSDGSWRFVIDNPVADQTMRLAVVS